MWLKRIVIGSLFVFVGLGSANAQTASKTWTLQDCIQYAIDHNIDVKQQELGLEEAKIATSNAKGNFLPNLSGAVNSNWNRGLSQNLVSGNNAQTDGFIRNSSYRLRSVVPIYNGLKNYNTLHQSKLQELASQLNIDKLKDDIRINVASSYLDVLLQKENIQILKNQYKLTLEQLNRSSELVKSGNLPEGEVLQLQATAAADLQRMVQAENSYAISKLGLNRLLNINLTENIVVKKEDIDLIDIEILQTPVEKILEKVISSRNEIMLTKANVDVAKEGVKIAKGDYLPNLSGFVNFETREAATSSFDQYLSSLRDNSGLTVGLSLNIPIFNQNRTKNGVKRSKINVLRRENQLEQTKQKVTQEVYQSYLNAKATYKTYLANQKTVEAQKLAFEYQQTRFDVGQSNLLDYTQSKIQYQNSETELLRVKYNLLFRLKILELYYNPIQ